MSARDPAKTARRRREPTSVIKKTRYVVGIDLGTTNTALAYVDRRSGRKARTVRHFGIEQLTEPGLVEARRTLPSVVYVRGEHELSGEQIRLPWSEGEANAVVGALARKRGITVPDRCITSAKSWLCHSGVDRKASILPWGAPEEVSKRSPVEVEALLLRHLRDAWNHGIAAGEEKKLLEEQDIVVTIPASFDEVARELTVLATRQAGLNALLIEEPQAALYAWIAAHDASWHEVLQPGQTVLVCDVGGGTTDFSLIDVTEDEDGNPGFERTAVGDHLLLGGDNMDLTLARKVEARVGKRLALRDFTGLVQACRDAKERLLAGEAEKVEVAVARRGAKLIGGTIRATVEADEVREVILDGFFPRVAADEPDRAQARAGLKEFGLPYESEPAITRHLKRFLRRHGRDGRLKHVDHVLFNGGVFRTEALCQRVLEVMGSWQERPNALGGSDVDLAVSRGAAYYGLVRRGRGIRIKSGAGRAYYLEVGTGSSEERSALCLIPRGLEEGGVVTIAEHPLELQANRPVVFPFHTSTVCDDPQGAVVELDPEDFEELAPLHTVIRVGRKRAAKARRIPVELVARFTEIGTIEMWAKARQGERRWRLELDTRPREESPPAPAPPSKPASPTARAPAPAAAPDTELPPEEGGLFVDAAKVEAAKAALQEVLRLPANKAQRPLEGLGKRLEEALGSAREGWPVPVIRALFDGLLEVRKMRMRSPFHEARWLNLVGFCLRPGFGSTLDGFRVSEMWKVHLAGMQHRKSNAVRLEWVVLWRRIAGGMNRGQQETIFSPLQGALFGTKTKGVGRQELAEYWRLAASLEFLSPKKKRRLGERLLELLEKGKAPPRWSPWALGRLGGRVGLYGPVDRLVSADVAATWLRRLLKLELPGSETAFCMIQLARLTGDRARDVEDGLRQSVRDFLAGQGITARALRPLDEVVRSEVRTQQEFYGDSVPIGLVLREE